MPEPIVTISILLAIISILFFMLFIYSIRKKKLFGIIMNLTFSLLMLVTAFLFATISVATTGYKALTHEELAAEISIKKIAPQKFKALFLLADGKTEEFILEGDEIYIDAHILKWKPVANIFGLHTAYELDRVAGRYRNLDEERTLTRTIYNLSEDKLADMFDLRRKYEFLSPLLDAEYGSATFIDIKDEKKLKVLVSTSGLLIRK